MTAHNRGDLILDRYLPDADATVIEQIAVATDAATAYRTVENLDLLTVRTPLLVAAMWLRGLPARLTGKAPDPLPALVIGAGVGLPGWILLEQDGPREIVIGAVGKFWQPVIQWRHVPAGQFAGFDEPGWAKLAISFAVTGTKPAVVTYRCRTLATDDRSRRRFLRYWWLIKPFAAHIMRAALRTIKADAEQS